MPSQQSPGIERITGRYLDAWEHFRDERFSVEDLENELLRSRDPEEVPDASGINQDLYRVAHVGLVSWYGEGEYEVAISPEATDEEWSNRSQDHMNWVRQEVEERQEERAPEPEEEQEASEGLEDDPEVLSHGDYDYMSSFVGGGSDLEGQARFYQAALSPDSHDGVVLRSYQQVASSADEIAEEVCDDSAMSETDCVYRFEVEDKEMAESGDDLEYRVYLREELLLSK